MSHWRREERREGRRDERQAERLHDAAVDAAIHGDLGKAAALQVSSYVTRRLVRVFTPLYRLFVFLARFQREARGGSCTQSPC